MNHRDRIIDKQQEAHIRPIVLCKYSMHEPSYGWTTRSILSNGHLGIFLRNKTASSSLHFNAFNDDLSHSRFFLIRTVEVGVQLGPLGTSATN
jgi:hypothetical protein